MLLSFFKGFGLALLVLIAICLFGWVIKLLFDLAVAVFGFIFGWTFPGIFALIVCIIVGIVFATKGK